MGYKLTESTARDKGRCSTWSCCGLDEPLANYTADHESPNGPFYFDIDPPPFVNPPPIGEDWQALDCLNHWCFSEVSQADADACAAAALKYCIDPDGWFYNDPQTCTITCDDGGEFTTTVPGGLFLERSKDEANAKARSYCEAEVRKKNLCIIGTLNNACYRGAYSYTLAIEGTAVPVGAFVVNGAMPLGMTMQLVGKTLVFSGTLTEWGGFLFTVMVTAESGAIALKTLGLCVLRIVTPDPPEDTTPIPPTTKAYVADAPLNEAYSVQFEAQACSGTYRWELVSGTLPAGMIFDSSGALHGTPTVTGDYQFEVEVTDDETGNYTPIPPPVRQPAGLLASFVALPDPGYVPGTFTFVNKTIGRGTIRYEWDFGDGGTSDERNPTHEYTSDYQRYTVTLTAYDGYISSSYLLSIGNCQSLVIKDFDAAEWAMASSYASLKWKDVINEDPALIAQGCAAGGLPSPFEGVLKCLSSGYDRILHGRMSWPLNPEVFIGWAPPFYRDFRYSGFGSNAQPLDYTRWTLNTCTPFQTFNYSGAVSSFNYVGFVVKKAPDFYPTGWVFQVFLYNGPYPPSAAWCGNTNPADWIPRYTALKAFMGVPEDDVATGLYTWTNNPDMYWPSGSGYTPIDVAAWRAADNTPLTVELILPP